MKRLTNIASLLLLFSINYAQSMESRYLKSSLINLSPEEILNDFYHEDIEPFISLKQTCKTLYACITPKMIGKLSCEPKSSAEKNRLLSEVVNAIEKKDHAPLLPVFATILVHAGANPNMRFMGASLLHKALDMNIKCLIKALFEHNAKCDSKSYLGLPIFFDAPTPEAAQLFVDKKINVNELNGNGHNVLWHTIDSKFPLQLVYFYLKHGVNVEHICKWDGSCILHHFAANNDIKNEIDFIQKAYVLLMEKPAMVNTLDHNLDTPGMVAEKTIKNFEKKYPSCVGPLNTLIELFKKYEKKS